MHLTPLTMVALSLATLLGDGAALAQSATTSPAVTAAREPQAAAGQVFLEAVLVEADPSVHALPEGSVDTLLAARHAPPPDVLPGSDHPPTSRGPDLRDAAIATPVPGGRAPSELCAALLSSDDATLVATPSLLAEPDAPATVVLSRPRRTLPPDVWGAQPWIEGLTLRLRVRPHYEGGQFRLEVEQEVTEESAGDASAHHVVRRVTVAAREGRSVLIHGLTFDREVLVADRTSPLAGVPLLGALFHRERREVRRRALTLILTPRWITGAEDLHAIFRERLRQRQEYIDRLYLQSTAVADRPPPDYARTRGLVEEIHQSMTAARSP